MEGRRSGAAWGWARFLLAVVACVAVAVGGGGAATAAAAATEAGAPSASVDCGSAITGLIDCLGYVQNGSKVEKPEGSCCPGLKKVLKTQASCLCDAFKSSAQFGVALNMTKALGLPAACGVSAPSVSNCKIPGLGASPAPAPHSSSHRPPAPAPAPASSTAAREGIRGSPAPAPAKAAAPTFSVPSVALLVAGLAVSACISL